MLPIALAVFVGFLTIGLPLPVLPLHLHFTLGLSPVIVGVAVGAQFVAALLSRAWAGGFADISGAKRAMTIGLVIAAISGLTYLASLAFIATPATSRLATWSSAGFPRLPWSSVSWDGRRRRPILRRST